MCNYLFIECPLCTTIVIGISRICTDTDIYFQLNTANILTNKYISKCRLISFRQRMTKFKLRKVSYIKKAMKIIKIFILCKFRVIFLEKITYMKIMKLLNY